MELQSLWKNGKVKKRFLAKITNAFPCDIDRGINWEYHNRIVTNKQTKEHVAIVDKNDNKVNKNIMISLFIGDNDFVLKPQ